MQVWIETSVLIFCYKSTWHQII